MIFITVYKLNKNLIKIARKKYAFFFPESESLTKTVLLLMNSTKNQNVKSSLYRFKEKYILIAENLTAQTLRTINEFCFYKTDNPIKIAFITEYGIPLIINNAIKRYGVAFSKN